MRSPAAQRALVSPQDDQALKDIAKIKKLLADNPIDLAIFTLGFNSALRATDIVAIPLSSI